LNESEVWVSAIHFVKSKGEHLRCSMPKSSDQFCTRSSEEGSNVGGVLSSITARWVLHIWHVMSMLTTSSFLFVVLPLACVENSRYCSHSLFEEMMTEIGYTILTHHDSKKLCYYMLQLQSKEKRR
jgi:hypothetical protein